MLGVTFDFFNWKQTWKPTSWSLKKCHLLYQTLFFNCNFSYCEFIWHNISKEIWLCEFSAYASETVCRNTANGSGLERASRSHRKPLPLSLQSRRVTLFGQLPPSRWWLEEKEGRNTSLCCLSGLERYGLLRLSLVHKMKKHPQKS